MRFYERLHFVKGIDPVADAFSGTVTSDVVSMEDWEAVHFVIYKGVGTTGTSTITIEACDDFAASNTDAVAFRYRRCANTADTQGALTAATDSGVATTAGSSEIYVFTVLKQDLAATGYSNVRLKAVEVADDAVLGCVLIIMDGPNYAEDVARTVIS